MKGFAKSRREFLKTTSVITGSFLLSPRGRSDSQLVVPTDINEHR